MKLTEFTENGITLKYYFQKSANENCNALVVVPANSMEKENSLNFVFNLAKLKNAHKLFIAASGCQHGLYLVKNGTDAPQRTMEALIEKYRIENGIESSNVYMIGFCASGYSCVQISVSKGYNAVITSFSYDGDWLLQPTVTKEKQEYLIRFNAKRIEDGKFLAEEWVKMVAEYVGTDDYWAITKNYLETIYESPSRDKLSIPKIYFFAGELEEGYRYNGGKSTVENLRRLGMNVKVFISPEDFTHLEMVPYFTKYFLALFEELGIN